MTKNISSYLFSLVITLGTALYFSKALTTVHPEWALVLALAGTSLILGWGLKAILPGCTGMLLFQLLQGGVGFCLAYFLFKAGWKPSLAFPAGALSGLLVFGVSRSAYPPKTQGILVAALLAGGLSIALRLGGIPGGLLFALALLGGYGLGRSKDDENQSRAWTLALFFTAVLAVGRAALQYYLVDTNYANLGVVITHPYTYMALFAGLMLPVLGGIVKEEGVLPTWLNLLLLGIILPAIFGVYVHVRPMAGLLLGLISSAFIMGLTFTPSRAMGVMAYLAMGTTVFGLPLFKHFETLSRWVRLEILGGLMVLAILGFLTCQRACRQR